MPHSLSTIIDNATTVDISPSIAIERPQQAAKAMAIISTWAYIDNTLIQIASQCLNADFIVVTAMLNELKSSHATLELVKKAVETKCPSDWPLFKAICAVIKPSRNTRNQLAHSIWAVHRHIPNGICLIDPRYISVIHAEAAEYYLNNTNIIVGGYGFDDRNDKSPTVRPSEIIVYRDDDLDICLKEAKSAAMHMDRMLAVLSNHPISDDMRKMVLEDLKIKEALNKILKNTKK